MRRSIKEPNGQSPWPKWLRAGSPARKAFLQSSYSNCLLLAFEIAFAHLFCFTDLIRKERDIVTDP